MKQRLLYAVIGDPGKFGLDARTLNGGSFITALTALIALFLNHALEAPALLDYPCVFGLLFGSLSWYLGRIQRLFIPSLMLLLFTQMAALTGAYLFNDGMQGPTPYFYVTLLPIFIFILRPAFAFFTVLLFFFNISFLYLLELKGYIHPVSYPNTAARMLDLYASLTLNFCLIILIVSSAKLLLLNEQKKTIESSKAKTQFLANISHEIRTPMNAILGLNELALNSSTDPQQKKWLKSSQDAAQHLLGLVEAMLDISSIDEGKLTIHNSLFPIRELVNDVVDMLRQFSDQKKLQLDVHIAEDVPHLVETDPVRLRQILVNLLNNSIKFTDEGKIRVSVSMEKSLLGGTQLLFSIRDTGVGVAKDQQEKIFNIFTQGENIDKFKHKGFGLGLSISKQLVEKMDGRIWLESPPSGGSTFFFTLPITLPVSSQNFSATLQKSVANLSKIKKSENQLLLVEDNDINADVAQLILQKNGFAVDRVIDGRQALDRLATYKYVVILMDIEMPIMDGFETTIALRSGRAGPLNQYTPIIAVTAHALNEYRERCTAVGMQSFIAKPFNSEMLLQEIQAFTGKHKK